MRGDASLLVRRLVQEIHDHCVGSSWAAALALSDNESRRFFLWFGQEVLVKDDLFPATTSAAARFSTNTSGRNMFLRERESDSGRDESEREHQGNRAPAVDDGPRGQYPVELELDRAGSCEPRAKIDSENVLGAAIDATDHYLVVLRVGQWCAATATEIGCTGARRGTRPATRG